MPDPPQTLEEVLELLAELIRDLNDRVAQLENILTVRHVKRDNDPLP